MIPVLDRRALAGLATGRAAPLLGPDLAAARPRLAERLAGRRVLVIGGAGSIGAATVGELTAFDLAALHVADLSENGLAELVRDLRSRPAGLAIRDFRTLPLDFGSPLMERFLQGQSSYDVVLNFAALKHVRSEKDASTLLQMLDTNVLRASRLLDWLAARGGTAHYFSVSTDKAANPVNLMGASKRLMEHVILAPGRRARSGIGVTSARFANVAFSAGSLLEGWLFRLEKRQPLAVPRATRRYFLSLPESGQLCLLAAAAAADGTIVVPRLDPGKDLRELQQVARALLERLGLRPWVVEDEEAARRGVEAALGRGEYPLLLTPLDTMGEKAFEEFVGAGEAAHEIGLPHLAGVSYPSGSPPELDAVVGWLAAALQAGGAMPSKTEILVQLGRVLPELQHRASEKSLDDRM